MIVDNATNSTVIVGPDTSSSFVQTRCAFIPWIWPSLFLWWRKVNSQLAFSAFHSVCLHHMVSNKMCNITAELAAGFPFSPNLFMTCFRLFVWANAFVNVLAGLGLLDSRAPKCLLGEPEQSNNSLHESGPKSWLQCAPFKEPLLDLCNGSGTGSPPGAGSWEPQAMLWLFFAPRRSFSLSDSNSSSMSDSSPSWKIHGMQPSSSLGLFSSILALSLTSTSACNSQAQKIGSGWWWATGHQIFLECPWHPTISEHSVNGALLICVCRIVLVSGLHATAKSHPQCFSMSTAIALKWLQFEDCNFWTSNNAKDLLSCKKLSTINARFALMTRTILMVCVLHMSMFPMQWCMLMAKQGHIMAKLCRWFPVALCHIQNQDWNVLLPTSEEESCHLSDTAKS